MSHDECKIFQTLRLLIAPKFINYDELLKLLLCLCWTIEMQLVAATGNWRWQQAAGVARDLISRGDNDSDAGQSRHAHGTRPWRPPGAALMCIYTERISWDRAEEVVVGKKFMKGFMYNK